MLIISLDEQGDFENLKNERDTKPVFIGGIIFDDKDDRHEKWNEIQRLKNYFMSVCQDCGTLYPVDLHGVTGGTNKTKERKTKTKIEETISEFFEFGTYQGKSLCEQSRKGEYHIYCMLRGKNGKTELLSKQISELIRDDYAANLYVHMAEEVVGRVIFHNPIYSSV